MKEFITEELNPDDAVISRDNAADAAEPDEQSSPSSSNEGSSTEIYFDLNFSISDIRKKTAASIKHRMFGAFWRSLIYTMLQIIPPIMLYVFALSRIDTSLISAVGLEFIGFIVWPLLIGGPLTMGFTAGCLDISRGKSFSLKRLIMGFTDGHIFRAMAANAIFLIVFIASNAVGLLPAFVISVLTAQLGAGFAHMMSVVLLVLFIIAGIAAAALVYLRIVLMFPLMVEYPDMGPLEAAFISARGIRDSVKRILMLMLSYIGWLFLFFGAAVIIIIAMAILIYFISLSSLQYGDLSSSLMMLYRFIFILYGSAALLYITAFALFIIRPGVALAALYNEITGYYHSSTEVESN